MISSSVIITARSFHGLENSLMVDADFNLDRALYVVIKGSKGKEFFYVQ